jgi:hypothetical protein
MKNYFLERCSGGAKTCNFWTTIKPFFSKKCNSGEQKIILCENNKIINDAKEVSENFNSFFSTVADKIGQNVVYDPSIVKIKNHVDIDNNFDFQNITAERVEKIINTIKIKKVTATVEKKELKFSETSFASFMILLFSQRIIFCSPELHFLEKKGLTVVQKLQVLAPPEQRSKKYVFMDFFFSLLINLSK